MWRWENTEPFGNWPPEENPSGIGNFEFPLQFPGQYFDKETGFHYSYFRDYDPQTGRDPRRARDRPGQSACLPRIARGRIT